ncbi:hypothetical protein AAVH_30043 [Aphelenchoides avenae]|nr:hypothetical protein AAVH_30043 [Aphelenchus avenae]
MRWSRTSTCTVGFWNDEYDDDDEDDDHDVGGDGTDAGVPVAGPSKAAICGVCHAEFATDKNLMKHGRTVCKEHPLYRPATYECPGCGRKFCRSDVLQKHRIRKEH